MLEDLDRRTDRLEESLNLPKCATMLEEATYYKEVIITQMQESRKIVDTLETIVGTKYWPMPTYEDLLFRV
jgi:glutamine synthetase